MADLITIGQLSALVEDQYRLLGWFEDNEAQVPVYDGIFTDRNHIGVEIAGEAWSITTTHSGWECCHRQAGRTVLLERGHPSPFDFSPGALLRFVQSQDADTRITDIVVDNWILKFVRAGRLSTSRHRKGYYTFG
jgi:hypothetical protein